MNIRLTSLSIGIVLSAIPFAAFAEAPYTGNYGAGYLPSPALAQVRTPISSNYPTAYPTTYQTTAPLPSPGAYGQGFSTTPALVPGNGSNLVISTTNYGSGFIGSPKLLGGQTNGVVYTGNYGSGFIGSPALLGSNVTPTVYTGNYGSGFIGSPNLVQTYPRVPPYGHYAAGFMVSPAPWYGYGWFRW